MRVRLLSFGCRVNQVESEAILEGFKNSGFDIVKDESPVEISIVNTCTVTSKAEQKARREIRKLSSLSKAVIVTGCYSDLERDEILSLGPNIYLFDLLEKGSLTRLGGHIKECVEKGGTIGDAIESLNRESTQFDFSPKRFLAHSRSYLKIQDGCDNACGYCRTTIARGKSLSLDPEVGIERAKELERSGYHEIILTGVNLANYNYNGVRLGSFIKMLLDSLSQEVRIRLSSLEPQNIDDELLDSFRDNRVENFFHLPLQTGSEKILSIIGRNYTKERIREIVGALREIKDDPYISSDIIAGLPGESDEDNRETYEFLSELRLSHMHVFPYSPREGTRLYRAPHPEERVRDQRAKELRELSERLEREYVERQIGKTLELIVEEDLKATSSNYLKCSVISDRPLKSGELIRGRLISSTPLTVSLLS